MLTGRETLAATAVATAHRHHAAPGVDTSAGDVPWRAVAQQVRCVALGWSAEGSRTGEEVLLPAAGSAHGRLVTLLAVAAAGGVAVLGDAAGARLDLEATAVAGAVVDERHPDRFESLVAARGAHDPLLRSGDLVHTSSSLLTAARALAQALQLGPDEHLVVDLVPGTVVELVAGLVVPCLTGAAAGRRAVAPGARAVHLCPPGTNPVIRAEPPRSRGRRRRPAPGRTLHVLDAGTVASASLQASADALSVGAAGGIVCALGGAGSVGRPLPGTSVGVADDGEVLVRSGAVAPGAAGLRGDGWLGTGLRGTLVDGALVLDAVAAPAAP